MRSCVCIVAHLRLAICVREVFLHIPVRPRAPGGEQTDVSTSLWRSAYRATKGRLGSAGAMHAARGCFIRSITNKRVQYGVVILNINSKFSI